MADKKVGVFGIYSTRTAAENATEILIRSGFTPDDISVLLPETLAGPTDMGTEKATKAPEGAAAGVTTGGIIGGTLGVLAGVGLLAIPGLGPFIAAGPIMAGLAGLGVGGAVGGFTGALIGMGIPEFRSEARRRSLAKGRNSSLRPLRHLGRNQARQASPENDQCGRCLLHGRILRRHQAE